MYRILQVLFVLSIAVSSAVAQTSGRIINGSTVTQNSYETNSPWMVGLVIRGLAPKFGHFCGGTLIGPQTVLTAGHCVRESGLLFDQDVDIYIGVANLANSAGTRIESIGAVVHPDYNGNTFENDLALVKLASPVSGVSPIELASTTERDALVDGSDVTILGWGQTDPVYPVYPYQLQSATVDFFTDTTCQNYYGRYYYNPEVMVCGGIPNATVGNGTDSCFGDSGGPMVIASSGKQVGIVSSGFVCGGPYPGLYTDVAAYSSWIASNPPIAPEYRTLPSVVGTPEVGSPLTCSPGTWLGESVSFSYRWLRLNPDYSTSDLATGDSYSPTLNDSGTTIYCEETGTNSSGTDTAASATVFIPEPTPTPTPTSLPDSTVPTISPLGFRCGVECTLYINTNDDSGTVASVTGRFVPAGAKVTSPRVKTVSGVSQGGPLWSLSFTRSRSTKRGIVLVNSKDAAENTSRTMRIRITIPRLVSKK